MPRARLASLPHLALVGWGAFTAAAAGCTDFASPAELTKPTVLAVIADPPIVAPGATTTLTVAMAGPDGPLEPDAVSWRVVETLPGIPPFGAVAAADGVSATYTAPTEVPELPEDALPIDSVEATITAGGEQVVVIKAVAVVDVEAANPTITAVVLGDEAVVDAATVARGQVVELTVATDPEPGENATFAWYTTAGTIDQYQSNPTELVGADETRDGWLFVVVRDGLGGVAWRGVEVSVP